MQNIAQEKHETPTWAPRGVRQIRGDWPGPVEGDRGGATANPKGSDKTQRMGRCPSARATARKGLIPPAKTRRERGYIANVIDQREWRKEKADGTPRT